MQRLLIALSSVAGLTACGPPTGTATDDERTGAQQPPVVVASEPENEWSAVAYPGARIDGNLFTSADPPDKVLSWYWNPDLPMQQRQGRLWTVSKPDRNGDRNIVRLTIVGDEGAQTYVVYLQGKRGGGTDGRIRRLSDTEIKSGFRF